MVFYDNHEASAKQINLFHAFCPHCRQLQREALAIGKHALLTLLGSRVTSFKFFGTMAFFPQLAWLLFPLHWRHAAGWDLALFPRVPGESSPWRVGVWEESAKCWWAPVDFQGEVMILGLSLLHVSDLNLVRKNACLQSRDPVCWYLWCLRY